MMSPALFISLVVGWMLLAVMALMATGGPRALRGLLAVLLLGLCAVGCQAAPAMAQALMLAGPALALCVRIFMPETTAREEGRMAGVEPFILSANATLAVACGRCDLLVMFIGLALGLYLAFGRQGDWTVLRTGLGGLVMAQGGLFVLQAGWGARQEQGGAVLLAGGLLLACGVMSGSARGQALAERQMALLATMPVLAQAVMAWPALRAALTFLGCVCLLWSLRPGARAPSGGMDWSGWVVLAAGLPPAMASLPLAACLLALACGGGVRRMAGPFSLLWPPFLPGVALALVLLAEMGAAPGVALLAGACLWPVFARMSAGAEPDPAARARAGLALALGCMVLALALRGGMVLA
ncbi:hypothetical protein B0W47_04625 [Komagataeibacter nataicola]|uniref:Uncharacterized protein n=2 Tax=Komagataeibacter nataicola TaxID=265960 RepID=A0A9N7CM21_9PROT|nr:hypothetical protein [Komagataeibacter nataicola]AQU86869.1 hypothetical protein B0W47_04625 [Komagataeibacter nataicola]PYD67886.1 hypothetical protein CDI09_00680 [Komagataeibacter nataicola]WEQ56176.1 hypothetical protein LV564_03475 [Komagataeibacter nataicola]GBR24121.1 hypothetical protein AA0616_2672 [Komagataeibacter nataicola NRIC 0616]